MSDFYIIVHTVRAQHTRDRMAGAELGRHNDVHLHVKQYIPKTNPNPKPGDVTIIGTVADAFPKETLEPLWDDLLKQLTARGKGIRGIWVADPVNQGESGVMNERLLGPDPSWFDHGRDLLFLINQVQDEMPHPIVGIGHSMGSAHLAHLALLHPGLLHSLVFMDPVFSVSTVGRDWAAASAGRRDLWPSRSAAAAKFRSNPAYASWDPRVLDRYISHGLRPLPTEKYPLPEGSDPDDPPVTLQTTKAQELYNYVRPAYHDDRYLLDGEDAIWREFWEEDLLEEDAKVPFLRHENKILFRRLPELKPSVLYLLGGKSEVSGPESRQAELDSTGTGAGGSGGRGKGRVKEVIVEGSGHLVPYEATGPAAAACAEFLSEELERWGDEERDRRRRWERLTRSERVDVNDLWMEKIGAKRRDAGREEKPSEKL